MKRSLITSSWLCRAQSQSAQVPALEFNSHVLENYRVVLIGAELAAWQERLTQRTGLTTSQTLNGDSSKPTSRATPIKRCCILVLCARTPHHLITAQKAMAALRAKDQQIVMLLNTGNPIESIQATPEYKLARDADLSVIFHSHISFAEDLKHHNQSALYFPCAAVEELLVALFTETQAQA